MSGRQEMTLNCEQLHRPKEPLNSLSNMAQWRH